MAQGSEYTIERADDTLRFTTTSFRADRGSVLHSGIFNKELASSFLAAIIVGAFLIGLGLAGKLRLMHYFIAAVFFVILFPLARVFVFRGPRLQVIAHRERGYVILRLTSHFRRKRIERSIDSLKRVAVDHVRMEPENVDGIKIVEKIALQHGTVIPGFGEVKEFYNVGLVFDDANYTIFSSSADVDAEKVAQDFHNYVFNG